MYFSTGAQLQAALNALPTSKVGSYVPFDSFYYGQTFMTGYTGTLTPIEHFVQIGAARGYQPNADFDPAFYASQYADLQGKGYDSADLLYHFLQYGLDEGRAPNASYLNFDGNAYLDAYPAVKSYVEAHLADFGGSLTNGAIAHYVKFGQAQGFVVPGVETYALTNDIDVATANVFNSAPAYTPGGTDFVNTLQDEDTLTGTGTNPTLNATLGSVNDAAEAMISPIMNGIETLNVRVAGLSSTTEGASAAGMDLQDSTGLQTLNVTRITDTNAAVTFQNLEASTTNLSASNATRGGNLTFDYREDELTGSAEVLNVTTDNLRLSSLNLVEGGDSNEDQGYFFETVNVQVDGITNLDSMTIAANAEEDRLGTANNQTVNFTVDANLEINSLSAVGAETMSIVANDDVLIAADEDRVLSSVNDGITTTELRSLTISGAGNVTIDGLEGHIDEKVRQAGELGGTLVVAAGAMTGNLTLGVQAAADANVSTVYADRADEDVNITSGSGNDTIVTYTNLAGDITTNAGNDSVSVTAGAGAAVLAAQTTLAAALAAVPQVPAAIAAAQAALTAAVRADVPVYANMEGVSTIDTGAGNDSVAVNNMLVTANDNNQAANGGFDDVNAATILTGAGDDTVTVNRMLNDQDWDNGVLNDANVDDTYVLKAALVNTGAGADTVNVKFLAENAQVLTEDGNDTVNMVTGTDATLLTGDTNADVAVIANTVATLGTGTKELSAAGVVDRLGAVVDLGAGNDTFNYSEIDQPVDHLAAHTLVGRDAELRGGAGTDTLNASILDAFNVTAVRGYKSTDTNANVTGVETVNLTIENQIDAATAAISQFVQNDVSEIDGVATIDVGRFDTDLAAINLVSNEDAILRLPVSEVYEAGSQTTFNVTNLRSGIALSLKANEATGVDGSGPNLIAGDGDDAVGVGNLADDSTLAINAATGALTVDTAANIDVFLNVDMANATGAADTFTLNLNGTDAGDDDRDGAVDGVEEFDISLTLGQTDRVGGQGVVAPAVFDAVSSANKIENLVVNFADTGSHSLELNGFGDAEFRASAPAAVAGDVSSTVVTSLKVTSAAVSNERITVDNTSADTISFRNAADTAATDANVTLRVKNASNNYNITTGTGSDILDLRADDVRPDDNTTTVNRADIIDAGAGRDTLIVGGDDSLGNNNLTTSGYLGGISTVVDDDVFENIRGVEVITIDTNDSISAAQRITLDEAAAEVTGVDTINIAGLGAQTVDLVLGNDFFVSGSGNGLAAGTLLIDASSRTTAAGALTLNIENKDDDQDVNSVDLEIRLAGGTTANVTHTLNVLNTGDQSRRVDLKLTTATTGATTRTEIGEIGIAVADADSVALAISTPGTATNSIDSITLVDGSTGAEYNQRDTYTIASEWTRDVANGGTTAFSFDASAIANTDVATDATGATGGATITVEAGDGAMLNIKGTQNADAITGGTLADTIDGQAGNDTIDGGLGADSILGGAGADQLTGNVGNDTIDGGAGIDRIIGGTGADRLTGGSEADTFVINDVLESTQSSTDTITDFATGVDKIEVDFTASNGSVVNFGHFDTVANSGDGDNSLDGTTVDRVKGDAYYNTTGQFVVDIDGNGDITNLDDIVINSANAVNAGDVNYNLTIAGGDNTVRLGQGVEHITTGAGNDTFVIVGALDAAAVAGYSNAGAGVVAAVNTVVAWEDLLTVRTASEANAGDQIFAGTGSDTLHVYGTADLSGVDIDQDNNNVSELETIIVHSNITMTSNQFDEFVANGGRFILDGDVPHTITITDSLTGLVVTNTTTVAEILARVTVTGAGTATTVSINGTAGTYLTAAWDAGLVAPNNRLEVTATNTGLAIAGDQLNGVGGAVVADNSYASSFAKWSAGLTGYTVVDALANYVGVDATINAVLAAAADVTVNEVSGNISALAYAANVDHYQLANNANATMTRAQHAQINAATGTNTVTLTDAGATTANAAVESYVLADAVGNVFTLSAAGQDVTGSATNADTVNGGSFVDVNSTLAGGASAGDVLNLVDDTATTDLNNVSGFETINIANTNASSYTTVNGLVAAAATLTVVQTGGQALTWNASAETDGQFNITTSGGNDVITLGSNALNDTVSSGAGTDSITLGTGNESIDAGADNDTIVGGANVGAADTLNGGAGAADLLTLSGSATVTTDANFVGIEQVTWADSGAQDTVTFVGQTEGIQFTWGADVGDTGPDSFLFGSGNDTLIGGEQIDEAFNETIDGGVGTDTVQFNGSFNDNSDGNLNAVESLVLNVAATLDLASQTESFTITGSSGNDVIVSGAGGDTITAAAGNDAITLNAGADSVDAGADNDTVTGGANVTSADTLVGGAGTDVLTITDATATSNLDNVSGFETIQITLTGAGAFTTVNGLVAAGQTLNVTQTGAFALTWNGSAETDGAFNISSAAGNDVITGGSGADSIDSGTGNDNLVGGDGADVFTFNTAADIDTNDTVDGGVGSDTLNVTDTLIAADLDNVTNIETLNLTISGGSALTLAGDAVLTGTTAAINVSGTGTFALSLSAENSSNIALSLTGSAGADTVTWDGAVAGISSNLLTVTGLGAGDALQVAETGVAAYLFDMSGSFNALTFAADVNAQRAALGGAYTPTVGGGDVFLARFGGVGGDVYAVVDNGVNGVTADDVMVHLVGYTRALDETIFI